MHKPTVGRFDTTLAPGDEIQLIKQLQIQNVYYILPEEEGPEGVKWELEFGHIFTGKMGFGSLGKWDLGHWDWD